ncbi:hypothetical protein L6452_14841 [Arctium lappa]|uniref:Uncharacterized protein n=1 Tax=Arctium lappa TaxID=4217 RepID=A0ACB9CM45_ARCLA|nr:hypothetical protein L6452_14841 [Arctium lappa]
MLLIRPKKQKIQQLGAAKDYTAENATAAKDYTTDKATTAKDYTADKVTTTKDYTTDKATATKDYTAEKAKEGKDTTVRKISELKDSAADAAKKAMDFLTGKKVETKENISTTSDIAKTVHLKDQGYEGKGTRLDTSWGGGRKGGEVVMTEVTMVVELMGDTTEAI